jgi:hypothetical protein
MCATGRSAEAVLGQLISPPIATVFQSASEPTCTGVGE